jgi:peptidoglycan/LPS O-acetylase OafA/YrhL
LFVYFSILRFFPLFWLGVVLADLKDWLTDCVADLPAAGVTALGWLGLTCFAFLPEIPDTLTTGLVTRGVTDLSIAAMFASAFAPQSGFRWFCARPWIALIGGACYSIYLVHIQLLQAMTLIASKLAPRLSFGAALGVMALEIAVVIVAGLIFYALIERPFMTPHWPRRLAERFGFARRPVTQESAGGGRATEPAEPRKEAA